MTLTGEEIVLCPETTIIRQSSIRRNPEITLHHYFFLSKPSNVYVCRQKHDFPPQVFLSIHSNLEGQIHCFIDELQYQIILIGRDNKSKNLRMDRISVNFDQIEDIPKKIVKIVSVNSQPSENDFWFLNPRDCSLLRFVQNSRARDMYEIVVEWFEEDFAMATYTNVGFFDSKVLAADFAWGNKANFVLFIGSSLMKIGAAHCPNISLFGLHYTNDEKPKKIEQLTWADSCEMDPKIVLPRYLSKTVPIGSNFKYYFFVYSCLLEPQNLVIIGQKSFKKSILSKKPTIEVSRVTYFSPFMDRLKQFLVDNIIESQIEMPNVDFESLKLDLMDFPFVVSGHLYQIVKYSLPGINFKCAKMIKLDLELCNKDYRKCANCGLIEKKKRKNKFNKRIAQFKVCRQCKESKLHLQWWKYPCHYCSLECLINDWQQHKQQHQIKSKN